MVARVSAEDRLLRKHRVDPITGCWLWIGTVGRDGYGLCRDGNKRRLYRRAHRLAFETWVGPIPNGMVVMHVCDNPLCINPQHLRAGTFAENRLDCINKGRHAFGERSHKAKLNPGVVRDIRRRVHSGEPGISVAKSLGISNNTVSRVARRVTWKHVH